MSEIIQKGWLTTRDGEKYAPNTLIESVFTRSGIKYDEQVRQYIANLQNSTTTNLTSINQQLSEHSGDIARLDDEQQALAAELDNRLKNLDASDSNTFFIIDNDENVVAYIDAEGIHAIEVEIPDVIKLSDVKPALSAIDASIISIQESIAGIEGSITNIDASDRDALFIIDGSNDDPEQCNVIAYIDSNGVHSVNFHALDQPDYISLVENVSTNTENIGLVDADLQQTKGDLASFKATTNTTLDELNTATKTTLPKAISDAVTKAEDELEAAITQEISNRDMAIAVAIKNESDARTATDAAHDTRISAIEENTKYFDGQSRDTLFITDEAGNTVAYINKDGLHIVNVIVGSTEGDEATDNTHDVYDVLTKLLAKDDALDLDLIAINKRISDEVKARESAVAAEKTARETMDSNLSIAVNLYTTKPSAPNNGDLYIDTSGNLFIYNEINSTWESFVGLSRQLKEKTQYFDGSADDKFYLVDNSGNVIAYFADDGLHAVNVFVGNDEHGSDRTETTYDVYSKIKQLLQDLEAETSRSTGVDANHSTRISDIETRLTNVSNVMDFVGVFNTLPAAASYQKGDVCVVGEKEYVHDGSEWKLLGDVSAEMARLDALEKIVGNPTTNATGTHEKRLDDLEANLATEQTARQDGDNALNDYIVRVEDVIEEMNSNFNWNDPNQNTLYIIDGEDRVLAQFDASGLTIIDTVIKDVSIDKSKSLKTQASYMLVESSTSLSWLS